MSRGEISILQLAAFIGGAGRTSELRSHADPGNLERSAMIFENLSKHFGFQPKLIACISAALINQNYPIKEDAFLTGKFKLMRCLLQNKHRLNMVRMLDKDTFDRTFIPLLQESLGEFVDEDSSLTLVKEGIQQAVDLCDLTGNRCLYINKTQDDNALKAKGVADLNASWQELNMSPQGPSRTQVTTS